MAKISRPQRISESTYLSKYYTVEGLIRLAESRMFYIVNDSRPDRPHKYCWSCGSEESSTYDTSCANCNEELRLHKFLVAARWQPTQTNKFMDFFELELEHPGMLQPFDVFVERTSMMAVYTWGSLEFLIDRPSPLSPKMVLKVAQNALGVLAFLHEKGIVLDDIGLHNFLLDSEDDSVYFFDPVIREMYTGPVPDNQRSFDLACLGETLRKLVGVEYTEIHHFLQKAREQKFQNTYEMGRALEALLNTFDSDVVDANVAGISDVGLVRVLNEDNWGWYQLTDRIGLYIVADGMGGHDAGEVASSMAVSLLIKECRQRQRQGIGRARADARVVVRAVRFFSVFFFLLHMQRRRQRVHEMHRCVGSLEHVLGRPGAALERGQRVHAHRLRAMQLAVLPVPAQGRARRPG